MLKFEEVLKSYKRILRWNGESVQELMESVRRLLDIAPFYFVQPLPFFLQTFRYSRSLRFDLSRVAEPILAVDKKGRALVGNVRSMTIKQLLTL